MSENDTNKPSRTDWSRLEAMTDTDIDYSDSPPLNETFFQRAKLYVPQSRSVVLDADVFAWFENQGKEYYTLVNQILRKYMEQHKRKVTKPKRVARSTL